MTAVVLMTLAVGSDNLSHDSGGDLGDSDTGRIGGDSGAAGQGGEGRG